MLTSWVKPATTPRARPARRLAALQPVGIERLFRLAVPCQTSRPETVRVLMAWPERRCVGLQNNALPPILDSASLLQEHPIASVAVLCHMVEDAGYDDAWKARHAPSIKPRGKRCKLKSVTVIPRLHTLGSLRFGRREAAFSDSWPPAKCPYSIDLQNIIITSEKRWCFVGTPRPV